MHAAGTIGTGPAAVAKPWPAFGEVAHHAVGGRQSERGAAREHDRVDARDASASGSSRSVSRVAGAPPRTSPEPTEPAGNNSTVTPVPSRVTWPDAHARDRKARHASIVACRVSRAGARRTARGRSRR